MIPLPASWIGRLNPERLLPSGMLALEPGLHSLTTLSIYPHATALDLAKLLAYIAAFILAAYVFDSHQKTTAPTVSVSASGGSAQSTQQ